MRARRLGLSNTTAMGRLSRLQRAYHGAVSTTHLLYLHGFRSSPSSTKARMMAARVARDHPAVHWWCPQLPASPRLAMDAMTRTLASWPRQTMAVVGSSLGGFYAAWLAEQFGCKVVLLNPAVHPARDLSKAVGPQVNWHDPEQGFVFEPRFVDELRALECAGPADPSRCFALIAKGDEVLDWREMSARYRSATLRLLDASDHALSDFALHMDEVFDFLDLV